MQTWLSNNFNVIDVIRGDARGRLGGCYPPLEHASPRQKVKNDFFRRFLAFIVPQKPYFSPLVGRVTPCAKIPGATHRYYHVFITGLTMVGPKEKSSKLKLSEGRKTLV